MLLKTNSYYTDESYFCPKNMDIVKLKMLIHFLKYQFQSNVILFIYPPILSLYYGICQRVKTHCTSVNVVLHSAR